MRMPNRDDDILLQTLQIGVKTSARDKLEEKLRVQLSRQNDAEAYFALALFNCACIPFVTDGQKLHKCLIDTIEWSSRSVEIDKEHWPALFLRSMVRLMMNDDETDEMAMYLLPIDYTEKDAIDDQYRMIDIQKTLSEHSPYCIVPYVQLAYAKVLDKDIKSAIYILRDAGEDIKLEKIPHLKNVIRLPFISLNKSAHKLGNHEMCNFLYYWIRALFPNQKL
ncbi:hypothetical protein PV797_10530 [Clostridiaceae bacterium M8S5]|nr:hypothetical protein PV797_10530 [Clostridiaceae bacterium M8S5]